MKRLFGWVFLLVFMVGFALVALGSAFSWHFNSKANVVEAARNAKLRDSAIESLSSFIMAESNGSKGDEYLQEEFVKAGVQQIITQPWVDNVVGETQSELLWLAENTDRTAAADLRNLKSMLRTQLANLDARAESLCNAAVGNSRCRDKARVKRLRDSYRARVNQVINRIPERLTIHTNSAIFPARLSVSKVWRWCIVAIAFFTFLMYAYLYRRPGYRMVKAIGRSVMFASSFSLLAVLGISSMRLGGLLDTFATELERHLILVDHERILSGGARHFFAEFTWESCWSLCVPLIWLTVIGFVTVLFGSMSESSTKRRKARQKKNFG